MTWSLSAAGGTLSEEAERELHQRISEILSDPKYRTTASGLVGAWVNGPAHSARKPPPATTDKSSRTVTARASRAAVTEGVHET